MYELSARPIGAVECGDCGEKKRSGNKVQIRDIDEMSTESRVLCDGCTDELRDSLDLRSGRSQ